MTLPAHRGFVQVARRLDILVIGVVAHCLLKTQGTYSVGLG